MANQAALPNYGVNAPGVIRTFLVTAAILAAAGVAAVVLGKETLVEVAGGLAIAVAVVPLGFGLAMVAYAVAGKRRMRDWMLARDSWRGDEVVLDVGAGSGLLSIGAAKRLPRGRVLVLDSWRAGDLSGNGPHALAANARIEGVDDRIEVITGDARLMDLPDCSVDLVLSLLCLHNIEPIAERERALQEIVRVLKPAGRAMIADYTATASYARFFRRAGLSMRGPINAMRPALSLMALVEAEKPGTG